jgi:hypothetical protein
MDLWTIPTSRYGRRVAIHPPLPAVLEQPVPTAVASLLESRVPARLAWVSAIGRPVVCPIWFRWTGRELEVVTFEGAAKLRDLSDGDEVAVTIDTDEFPYRSLTLRGSIRLDAVIGLADSYAIMAQRYLGATAAARWLAHLDGRNQTVIAVRPEWAKFSDLAASRFWDAP